MSLLRRYEQILEGLVIELKRHYGQRLVACAVFGSVGRGTPRRDSDIDLLLVIRDLPRGRLRRVEEFLPVEERIEPALACDEPDGDIDFIPTEEYTAGDADRAYAEAAWIVELAGEVITRLPS